MAKNKKIARFHPFMAIVRSGCSLALKVLGPAVGHHSKALTLLRCHKNSSVTGVVGSFQRNNFIYIIHSIKSDVNIPVMWNGFDRQCPYTLHIVACQRGGVSNKPPVLRAATRHGPLTLLLYYMYTG